MPEDYLRSELIKKYQWAGKIRFLSSFLLFLFLLLMKTGGGYTYLNVSFSALIFVEAILNQPYKFLLKRVNLYRFQFYQMVTDIIAISWVVYYMGGIDAPIVNIAYYAVILWAGVVSGASAVFFAVTVSCISFSLVVICEHFAILPQLNYFSREISATQFFSLLLSNIAFMFAFGYFSTHSSGIIKFIERKRQEEALKYTHKLLATGYLLGALSHDIVNHLASIRGYAKILLEKTKNDNLDEEGFNSREALKAIERLESENIELFGRLSRFSRQGKEKRELNDLNKMAEEALGLILPLAKASGVNIEKIFAQNLPLVLADKDQIQEVLVTMLLSSVETVPKKGKIVIKTAYLKEIDSLQLVLSDTGSGMKKDYLEHIAGPFFTNNKWGVDEGLGFNIAHEIIKRHNGKIEVKSIWGSGTKVIIQLPVKHKD